MIIVKGPRIVMKYDDFCKQKNHFEEGWLCFNEPHYFLWFKHKPRYLYSKGVWWCDEGPSDTYWTDCLLTVDCKGINPNESLRKVGEE